MAMLSKLLTEVDIKKSLMIPSCSMGIEDLQGHNLFMNVLDNSGKAWSFPCSVHRDDDEGSVVVCVCWDEFVREKKIRVDDMIVIKEKSVDDMAIFRVDVKRKIRLFGQDIWADI